MCLALPKSLRRAVPLAAGHRTTNDQNQITSIGSANPTYDSNGNITKDDHGDTLVYDAWNRLVAVYNASGVLLAGYTYDGYGRMTSETSVTTTTDFYYSGTQDIQERTGVTDDTGASLSSNGTTTLVNVYSPDYVNDILLRDSGGTRVYFSHDLTYSVTGVFSSTGTSLQRQVYDSYGDVTFLNASWASTTDAYKSEQLWQGGWRSQLTDYYHFDARWYSPSLQWLSWDPANYPDGLSGYLPMADNPINRDDPSGLMSLDYDGKGGIATLNVDIAFNWVNAPGDAWTPQRESSFQNNIKQEVESEFNGTNFKLYPTTSALTQYNDKGRALSSKACPGQSGIVPKLKVDLTGSPDFRVNVLADASKAWEPASTAYPVGVMLGSLFGSSVGDWAEDDDIMLNGQIGGVHEFGHLLGLHHPGQDQFPPATPNSSADYSADADALMGSGMAMRAQYFQPWADQLHYYYALRNYSVSFVTR